MPYIPKHDPHEKSRRLLKGYEITAAKLASYLMCSEPTARGRLRNPGKLTGDEWLTISRRAHIPVEEIRSVFLS